MRRFHLLLAASLAAVLLSASPVSAEETDTTGAFVAVEWHQSLLTGVANRTLLNITYGGALRGGYRFGRWGVFGHVEQNLWQNSEQNSDTVQGALNLGVGGEYLYADGFVRTTLVVGPSILLFDTILDDAGSTGFFLDLRPVGLRWNPWSDLHINLDPLTFAIVAPVLDGIPLVQVEYRTTLGVEWAF